MTIASYRRILLKLSGEALMGDGQYGIDPATVARMAAEVKAAKDTGLPSSGTTRAYWFSSVVRPW